MVWEYIGYPLIGCKLKVFPRVFLKDSSFAKTVFHKLLHENICQNLFQTVWNFTHIIHCSWECICDISYQNLWKWSIFRKYSEIFNHQHELNLIRIEFRFVNCKYNS